MTNDKNVMDLTKMNQFFDVFDKIAVQKIYDAEFVKPLPLIAVEIAQMAKDNILKINHDLTARDLCIAFAAWVFHKNGKNEVTEDEFSNGVMNLYGNNLFSAKGDVVVCKANARENE